MRGRLTGAGVTEALQAAAVPSPLHIALVGPATLSMLQPHFAKPILTSGYDSPVTPVLAEELRRLGHHVSIVTTATDIDERLEYHGVGLTLIVVPARPRARHRALDLFAVERARISTAISELRPDVIHAQWTYEFALGAIDAKVAPTLVTARDAPLTVLRLMPDAYRLLRAVLAIHANRRIDHMSAVSPDLASRWRKEMRRKGPISVIPNPLPNLSVAERTRSKTPVVIGVGNNSRLKNYKALLRAFPMVLAAHPSATLRLIGPGLDKEGPLARWASAEALVDSVSFVGAVDRDGLARELSAATVFCHPSLEESFGNVLLEALTAGLPVVAGERSGGVPWVLFDGRAGTLVDVRSPERIAEGIIAAIDDPRRTVASDFDLESELRDRYSIKVIAQQYLSEYSRILSLCAANGGG